MVSLTLPGQMRPSIKNDLYLCVLFLLVSGMENHSTLQPLLPNYVFKDAIELQKLYPHFISSKFIDIASTRQEKVMSELKDHFNLMYNLSKDPTYKEYCAELLL